MELKVKLTNAEVERIVVERVAFDLGLQDYNGTAELELYGNPSLTFTKPPEQVAAPERGPMPFPSPVGGVV